MALQLLLVDPDIDWLSKARSFFEEHLYEVETANNGKSAQLALYNKSYFAIILNLDVQNHSGLEVLKFIKTNHSALRVVVVMEDESRLSDGTLTIDRLVKMGATEVLVKTFGYEDLADVLEGQQRLGDMIQNIQLRSGQSDEVECDVEGDEYTKVKISEFYSSKAVLFDLFIRLGANKFVKILHAGDTFSKDRIDRYKNEKGVEFLWFHNNDRRKYIQYVNHLAAKVTEKDIGDQVKLRVIQSVSDKLLEEAYTVGMKPQVIEQGKQICESIYKTVEKQTDLWKVLRQFQNFDPNAYSHSYLVTMFTAAIIKQFDWQSKAVIETASMACLFHDIGKMKLPSELIIKRPAEMSEGELEEYRKHPEYGAEILDGNLMINQSVKQIILQHHECFNGTGFPGGLKGNKVLTLANIVGLADDFVHSMQEEDIQPVPALKALLGDEERLKKYNSVIIENFIKVFTDPGKIKKDYHMPSNSRIVESSKKAS